MKFSWHKQVFVQRRRIENDFLVFVNQIFKITYLVWFLYTLTGIRKKTDILSDFKPEYVDFIICDKWKIKKKRRNIFKLFKKKKKYLLVWYMLFSLLALCVHFVLNKSLLKNTDVVITAVFNNNYKINRKWVSIKQQQKYMGQLTNCGKRLLSIVSGT